MLSCGEPLSYVLWSGSLAYVAARVLCSRFVCAAVFGGLMFVCAWWRAPVGFGGNYSVAVPCVLVCFLSILAVHEYLSAGGHPDVAVSFVVLSVKGLRNRQLVVWVWDLPPGEKLGGGLRPIMGRGSFVAAI